MKKFTFVLMVAAMMLFAAAPLFAQSKPMLGVKAGLNLANLTDLNDASMKAGLVAGAFLSYDFSEIIGIQPEVLFSMKGAKESGGDGKFNLNYIEIPVLLKINLPTQSNIKPHLLVGPGFGFLMSAKLDDVDVKDAMETFDIGIAAGAGIDFKMNTSALTLDVRYEVGMSKVAKEEGGEQPDWKNSVVSFMVGYGFSL